MSTYTYVTYFSDEDPGMVELQSAYHELAADFESRKPFMHPKAAAACNRRLEVLRHAWAELLEPVPRPYGG